MPHLDIITNVTVLNSVAVLSVLLQVVTQCIAKKGNSFLIPSIITFIIIFVGYSSLLVLSIMKDPKDVNMALWVGLAVGGSILASFSWLQNYFKLICENNSSIFLKGLLKDMTKCQNILHIMSSFLRIVVTTCVLGACIPLTKTNWDIVSSIPGQEKRIILILIGVQLISSALCHWFALAACKIQAIRRCFISVLYMASMAVMALFIIPVIFYYQDYRINLDTTESINFTSYCNTLVDERNPSLSGNMLLQLVLDVTRTLCYLDMSNIGLMTGVVPWWITFGLATFYVWYFKTHCIHLTQNQFMKSLYDGVFIEQSLLLNTQFDIHTNDRMHHFRENATTAMVYLCSTMWHETDDEMKDNVISMFRLDRYRPKTEPKFEDFTCEAHIYFDDAFENAEGKQGRHLNKYAKNLMKIISEVYGTFINTDDTSGNQEQIPDWKILKTPYGGRLVVTMPHGNDILVHFKDKDLIRNKKRWTLVMYLYYLLDWKLMTKNNKNLQEGQNEKDIATQIQEKKKNTYLLALDGDTSLQPTDLKILIDHLKMYPRVGSVSGRVHPTGTGPVVWFQKFEYAINNWMLKSAEHVFGSLLCSPGSCSLFRAEALMDDNVMEKLPTKSTEPKHYILCDQGEDRFLTSLLLKQGWTVEYIDASNSYSTVPQNLKELYNQRRRWVPTIVMNTVDLIFCNNSATMRKSSMSRLYILYHWLALFVYIVTPATASFCVAGVLSFLFNIHFAVALVIAVIPPAVYVGLCFKLKEDTQITIAAVLSTFYAFLMLVLIMTAIGSMVKGQTILTPSSIFVVPVFINFFIIAIMHPKELSVLFYALFYIIYLPSAEILLFIYTMVNMNCIYWGTRETKPDDGTSDPAMIQPPPKPQCWIRQLQNMSREIQLQEDCLSEEEENYWKELQDKYLQPFQADKETDEKRLKDLREFRNKVCFWFFFGNVLWLFLIFNIKTFKIFPSLINIDINLEETGEIIQAEFLDFMFYLGPGLIFLLQFMGLLFYRVHTIIDYIASLDTEPEEQIWKKKQS
ncbi:chitin synthase chs-1-like isoform X2 [Kryptolebias marmoratus]|uniref:chitin synthase chs-1-like isoform X2 n=3 Tax=Kryptolebias marmoratus TaxID=37003 RepID=UPI0018ACAD31|nr:chitin synthase chs-1-like isoform X2 [Kryptolebias marmoratus]